MNELLCMVFVVRRDLGHRPHDLRPGVAVKLRLLRVNPQTVTPGECVLICARALGYPRIVQFPAVLQFCIEDTIGAEVWQTVEVVNDFEVNDT